MYPDQRSSLERMGLFFFSYKLVKNGDSACGGEGGGGERGFKLFLHNDTDCIIVQHSTIHTVLVGGTTA